VPLEGGRVRHFPRQVRRYCASFPLQGWLRKNIRNYDIVHTHGLFSFAPLAAAWAARAAGVPYVMRPAGVLDTWGMTNKSVFVKRTSLRLLDGPLLAGASAVHFMTELERSRAAELRLPIRPVVLPLGFDFSATVQPRDPVADLGIDGKQVVLYVARLHKIKCVDVLLRAFAGLPNRESTVLLIAGDGERSLVNELQGLATQLGLGDRVKWLGFADPALKVWLFSRANVFTLPSASENFGIAVIEAMHAGLPVVVTSGCGLASMVHAAQAGLVTDGSVEALRAALHRLLTDEALRQDMGAAGRRLIDKELSLEAFGGRLEELYRSIRSGATHRAAATVAPGVEC
jgi:glycosyltransferase involved in cell wall biosynthesis